MFLGNVETAVRPGLKSRFDIMGFSISGAILGWQFNLSLTVGIEGKIKFQWYFTYIHSNSPCNLAR